MADGITQEIIIKFTPDTTDLQPVIDKLASLGAIDADTANIFKQTNAQIQTRNTLLNSGLQLQQDTSDAVTSQQAAYNGLTSSLNSVANSSKNAAQNASLLVSSTTVDNIAKAADATKDYSNNLNNNYTAATSATGANIKLRTELQNLRNEMTELIRAGQGDSTQFQDIAQKAGTLTRQLATVRQETQNLSTTAPGIKVLGGAIQGLTGAFTAAEGVNAAFGDDNKDLQQVLVSVNGVIAINTGLMEVLNIVRDEALISTAKLLLTETLNNAELAIENGLLSESIVVRAGATVAQLALNAAMEINPVVLVVAGLIAAVAAFINYEDHVKSAIAAQSELNEAVTESSSILDAGITGIKATAERTASDLEASGAASSQVLKVQGQALVDEYNQRAEAINNLTVVIQKNQAIVDANNADNVKTSQDTLDALSAADKKRTDLIQQNQALETDIYVKQNAQRTQVTIDALNEQIQFTQSQLSASTKNTTTFFNNQRQLAAANSALALAQAGDDAAKQVAIQQNLQRQIKDINEEQAKSQNTSSQAGLDSQVVAAEIAAEQIGEKLTQQLVDAQKTKIQAEADFEVTLEGTTQQEKADIQAKARQQQLDLDRQFLIQREQEAFQADINANNVELQNQDLTNQQRLALTVENINAAANSQIQAANNNATEIEAITIDRDNKIKAATLQSIQQTADQQVSILNSTNDPIIRNLQNQLDQQQQLRSLGNSKAAAALRDSLGVAALSLPQQLGIIDQITDKQLAAVKIQQDAVNTEYDEDLITVEDYNTKTAALTDQAATITENAEKKKQEAIQKTAAYAKQQFNELVQQASQIAGAASQLLSTLVSNQNDAAQDSIDQQKQHIQDLQDANDISADEAQARNAQLDVQQRKLNHDEAVRQKNLAIFNASISLAQAVIKAYSETGPIAGPIFAGIILALGAAEIAAIASKPIPAAAKGKKDNYEGLMLTGEAGAELMQKDGQMYIVKEPTIQWVGSKDIIYNPKETSEMLDNRVFNDVYEMDSITTQQVLQKFDYDKMGEAVGRHVSANGIGFDVHGMYEYYQTKQSYNKIRNNKRNWHK